MKAGLYTFCVIALIVSGCASRSGGKANSAGLTRLGNHSLKVTTASRDAQRAFDRGLTLAYAFSHYAAEQEFRHAAELDPECAMAWWGVALVNGPHINFPMVPPQRAATAWEALTKAKSLAARTSPLEQSLIRALGTRYTNPQPEDRSSLDEAYAKAMQDLWREYPNHADVGALCAEALMDLHPWDLWTKTGPQPWTPEIVSILERVMELNSNHPGANHFYIHAIEASPHPEKAVPAADRLAQLTPDASHNVHMPAHIYARVGRWEDAAQSNRDAMKADLRYRAAFPRPGFYALYMAHNSHFLGFAAMMQGRSEEALACARAMVKSIPESFIKEYTGVADGFLIYVSEVLMRFGRWEEILNEPAPRPGLPYAKAKWHFTRASALTALNRPDEARAEQEAFRAAVKAVPHDWTFGNNSATNLLAIAERVLAGEMAAKAREFEKAQDLLRDAIEIEDNIRYDEPPDWVQPVRHTLGAVLLKAGRPAEAEAVYRADLQKFPENGWSLMGLRDALKAQNKDAESLQIAARFKEAWRKADVQPSATCYCQVEQ